MSRITNESRPERPETSPLRRFVTFFLILLGTLGVVLAAAWRDGTGFDALRRYFSHAGPLSGEALLYEYESDASNRFARVGSGGLLIVSDTAASLLGSDGALLWTANVQMSAPAVHSAGDRAVAYDVGGTALFLFRQEGEVTTLTAEGPIISARLNRMGMLAVTESSGSGKGVVRVYDADLEPVFIFTSQRRFLADACVSEDGKYLAAAALGQEESVFVSSVILYRLTEKTPAASFVVKDALVLSMQGQEEGVIMTVTDTCLQIGSVTGEILGRYDYDGSYLREYDLSGEGFGVLLLGRYASGVQGRLVTVDTRGREVASLEIGEEVRSISVCGRYLSVLYTDRCVVYNENLEVYAVREDTERIRRVLTREDGSVLLIAADRAEVFLP